MIKKFIFIMTVLSASNLVAVTFLTAMYFFLMIIDTGIGRYCARVKARKEGRIIREEVQSKKTRLGFISKFSIFVFVIGFVFLIDHFIFDLLLFYWKNDFPFHYTLTAIFLLIFISWEVDSIDEHVYSLTGVTIIKNIKNTLSVFKKTALKILSINQEVKEKL